MILIYICLVLFQVGLIVFFAWRNRLHPKPESVSIINPFDRQRNIALNVSPAQLKLTIPDDETLVYGMVIDMEIEGGFMTLACYITGAAALYFSSGGRISEGGKNVEVAESAVEFVTEAQGFLETAQLIKIPVLPEHGFVNFYFLTNKGKYIAKENMNYINDNSSLLLGLFEKASNVISKIHKNTLG